MKHDGEAKHQRASEPGLSFEQIEELAKIEAEGAAWIAVIGFDFADARMLKLCPNREADSSGKSEGNADELRGLELRHGGEVCQVTHIHAVSLPSAAVRAPLARRYAGGMPIRPIVISGDPVLHSVAAPVTDFGPALAELVADMYETMDAAPGVGLAAPQIGVPLRVFVYDYPDDDGNERRGVAVNPELFITPLEIRDLTEADDEGCLSFPGERFPLVRAEQAILRAHDIAGKPFEIECDGWFARIMQHEFDHLNGLLYVDRLAHLEAKAAEKARKKNGWGKPGLSWMPGVDNLEG